MPLFYYTARTQEGELLRGSIDGSSDSFVLAALRTRALIVTSLESAGTARGALARLFVLGSVGAGAIATFYRAFATLIRAGVPIRRALGVTIAQCSSSRLREALSSILNDVENGVALSTAMGRHPHEFSRTIVAMVRAGESAGSLDVILERLASLLEHERSIRKRIVSSLAYPAVVVVAALGIVTFLLSTVVPMFAATYAQMRLPLPPITVALMSLSRIASSPLICMALSIPAGLGLITLSAPRGRARTPAFDTLRLKLPVVGPISRKTILARLARTLATMLHAGVPLSSALELASDVAGNQLYRDSMATVSAGLHNGLTISEGLQNDLYDPMFLQLLAVGEETGTLDAMLMRIAEFYDVDVDAALAALTALIEPSLILCLGGAIAFIVAAIFLPLYTLIGSIK